MNASPRRPAVTQRLFIAALLALAASAGRAETNAVRALSLGDCIVQALEHNFDLKIERFEPALARQRLSLAYGDYDPTFKAGLDRSYAQEPPGYARSVGYYRGGETTVDSFSLGIGGLGPLGLNYDIGANASDTHGSTPSLGSNGVSRFPIDSSRGSVGLFSASLPLLKNAWIDQTRYTLKFRRKDVQFSELGLKQQLMNVVSSVEQAYFELIAARESVEVQRKAVELAEALWKENSLRVQIGVLEPLDEKQSQSQMASSRADLENAERVRMELENVLKNLITDHFEELVAVTVEPKEALLAVPQTFVPQESWTTAFSHRPDLLQLLVDLERRGLTEKFQRNQLFPQLDLTGSVGLAGGGSEFSDVFGNWADTRGPFHSYGAVLSIPLGNRRARDNLKITRAEKAQAEERLKQFRQNIIVEVENAVVAARSALRRVDSTRQAREFAEEALDAGQKRLASGRVRSFEVLQLQRDLTTARSEEIRALADYNRALTVLRLREGTILKKHNIDVEVK